LEFYPSFAPRQQARRASAPGRRAQAVAPPPDLV